MGKPFARAQALMAAVAMAIMNSAAVNGFAQLEKAKQAAMGYTSRGKGGKRAARKARNVKANRRAHR